jgi:hypothetical protein
MDADQLGGCLQSHQVRDEPTPVTALRHKSAVPSSALHPRPRHAAGSQPVVVGCLKPVAGHRRITRWKASDALPPSAVGSVSGSMIFSCSMGEAGPAVGDDERHRILML